MARHVATYECEWKATLDDPDRLARFVSFVNAPDEPDPDDRVRRGARPDPSGHRRRAAIEPQVDREVAVAIR